MPKTISNRQYHLAWGPGHLDFLTNKPKASIIIRSALQNKLREDFGGYAPMGHDYRSAIPEGPYKDHEMSDEERHHHLVQRGMMDERHRTAMKFYKRDSTSNYNMHLRDQNNHDPVHGIVRIPGYIDRSRFDDLDEVTNRPIAHDMTVYRGFDGGLPIERFQPGHVFQDHGYTGTSRHINVADAYTHSHPWDVNDDDWRNKPRIMAAIHVPKGSHGHFLDLNRGDLPHFDEQEFLLHRGTKFQVMHHGVGEFEQPWGENKRLHMVHVKVIGHEPRKIDHKEY